MPSLSSRERKWTRPDPSPATIFRSPANTQQRGRIAGEGGDHRPRRQVPHLERPVIGGGDRLLPSRVTATAQTPKADEGAEFPAAGEVTNLELLLQTLRQIGAVVPGVRNKDRLWSSPRSGCFPHTVTMASRCRSTGCTRSSQALAAPYPYVL